MRLTLGLVAFATSRNKVGYLCDVTGGLLIADDGPEMVPLRGFVSTVGTTNVIRAYRQNA